MFNVVPKHNIYFITFTSLENTDFFVTKIETSNNSIRHSNRVKIIINVMCDVYVKWFHKITWIQVKIACQDYRINHLLCQRTSGPNAPIYISANLALTCGRLFNTHDIYFRPTESHVRVIFSPRDLYAFSLGHVQNVNWRIKHIRDHSSEGQGECFVHMGLLYVYLLWSSIYVSVYYTTDWWKYTAKRTCWKLQQYLNKKQPFIRLYIHIDFCVSSDTEQCKFVKRFPSIDMILNISIYTYIIRLYKLYSYCD